MFLFHWKEESQHAIIDELEWRREDAKLDAGASATRAVDDLIALVGGVDGILQAQAAADADYFLRVGRHAPRDAQRGEQVAATLLKAYRWQYIVSGAQRAALPEGARRAWSTPAQMARIQAALAPLTYAMPAQAEAAAAMTH